MPETPSFLQARFYLDIDGATIEIERDLVNVINRPERGEVYRPVEIVPEYTVSIQNPILFFQEGETKTLTVRVQNHTDQWSQDTLTLDLPRSEEHTSELQSRGHLVCRLLLE